MTSTEQKAVKWQIHGRVQGVAFRWFTRQQATELGVSGWVRNCSDGSVEVEAHGDEAALESLKDRLATGPPAARVDDIEEQELGAARARGDFRIAR